MSCRLLRKNGWARREEKRREEAGPSMAIFTSLPSLQTSPSLLLFRPTKTTSLFFNGHGRRSLFSCSAKKKKISFVDQILDYIEGGPKLRKWYGAPELLPNDGFPTGEEDNFSEKEEEVRDAVLVTDGESDVGQMVILSLIVKRTRVKALVKDKRKAAEAFGDYVESIVGDAGNKQLLTKVLSGVRSIICPNEGFLSAVGSLQGIKHVVLLSQLSVYKGTGGIQALMKGNAAKLAEEDEARLMALGIPYTIIKAGILQDSPGGQQGFSFEEGSATKGSLSKEDAAVICVEALNAVPQTSLIFEVSNGDEKVLDWSEHLVKLMERP